MKVSRGLENSLRSSCILEVVHNDARKRQPAGGATVIREGERERQRERERLELEELGDAMQ